MTEERIKFGVSIATYGSIMLLIAKFYEFKDIGLFLFWGSIPIFFSATLLILDRFFGDEEKGKLYKISTYSLILGTAFFLIYLLFVGGYGFFMSFLTK